MKPRKQRLHSAELRRLDHIAQSLDRIAGALEKIHSFGNNDVIIDKLDVSQTGGHDRMAIQAIDKAVNNSGEIQCAEHDVNNVSQSRGGNAAFGNVSGDTTTVHGNGQILHRISGSYNTNADETIKNLIDTLKP